VVGLLSEGVFIAMLTQRFFLHVSFYTSRAV